MAGLQDAVTDVLCCVSRTRSFVTQPSHTGCCCRCGRQLQLCCKESGVAKSVLSLNIHHHESSLLCRCWKNEVPVYCPALTDGSIGDMMFFHSVRSPGLKCDIIEDIRSMNNEALKCKTRTGVILLGGGVPKHHILNANLMRNGCDYCVLLNTAQEFDGSDSGARPDEAISWGKIRMDGKAVKVCIDATIGFPLLVSQTFAKMQHCK